MSDEQKIEQLRRTLKPVIDWYKAVQDKGEPDGSYLYDTIHEVFSDNLTRGDFQTIVEMLL